MKKEKKYNWKETQDKQNKSIVREMNAKEDLFYPNYFVFINRRKAKS